MAENGLLKFLKGGQGAHIFDWITENNPKPIDWKKIGIYSAMVAGCVIGVIGLYHMGELQNKIDAQRYGKSSELVIRSAATVSDTYTKN